MCGRKMVRCGVLVVHPACESGVGAFAAAAACYSPLLLCCICNPRTGQTLVLAFLCPWTKLSPLLVQFGAKSCWFSGDNFLWYAV